MDLLTTVMHELGHQIGLDDNFDTAAANDLMFGFLGAGERRLPDATDAAVANAAATAEGFAFDAPMVFASTPAVPAVVQPVSAGHDVAGTAGADAFVFDTSVVAAAAGFGPALPHIAGYSAAQGDTLDVSMIYAGYSGALNADMLRVVEHADNGSATVQLNSYANGWISVAQLYGVHAGDAVNAVVNGNTSTHHAQLYEGFQV
jgi:hypothetical protein